MGQILAARGKWNDDGKW